VPVHYGRNGFAMLSPIVAGLVLRHFTSSGGSYHNNPLVAEQHLTARDARELDGEGKGGGLVDGRLVREFPDRN
jgi:hypothetical protein